jgi:hypothetical protein
LTRRRRTPSTRSTRGRQCGGYGASSRTVVRDDADADTRRAAHGLVDGGGLRRVPGDHPQHVGGVRCTRTGARSRAEVRSVTGLATLDYQGMGGRPAASRPVNHLVPSSLGTPS